MGGNGTVTFTDTVSGGARTLDTSTDGKYRGSIPTGTYAVAGTISKYQNGHATCAVRLQVVVRANGRTHADLYCQER
jgi:hypothetical protein